MHWTGELPPRVALVIATSGSEGEPRGVMLSNASLDAAATVANRHLPLKAGDLWLDCLPLHHIGGLNSPWLGKAPISGRYFFCRKCWSVSCPSVRLLCDGDQIPAK
ncbi:MAG: AMP-binding protein [Azonexus sp.]|nr:AMP-binding protein [Azonexus sp.]